jgi:hypothetical protein
MTNHRNNLKAGIFILLSVALIVGVIFSIQGFERLFTPEQTRSVSFRLSDDLGGLQVGDEVRLGGFKVGAVKDIQVRRDVREVGGRVHRGMPATAPACPPPPPARAGIPRASSSRSRCPAATRSGTTPSSAFRPP